MLDDYLEINTLSLVFVGEFNPVIIQPFWLAHKGMIRDIEAQNAKVEIVHNEIVRFEIGWAKVEISKERFELRTSQEDSFGPLKDLAVSIFEVLRETPITALGFNHLKYYALPDEKLYFNVGDRLAPLSNWNEVLENPKMLSLDIVEQKRKDKLKGHLRVRIQASDIKLSTNFGVLISINDHFDLEAGSTGREGEMVKLLGNKLDASIERAKEIIEIVWSKIK